MPDGKERYRGGGGVREDLVVEFARVGDWEEKGDEAFECREEGRGAGFEGQVCG